MTNYKIIQTEHFKRSLSDFLITISPDDKRHFVVFQGIFDNNPFDVRIKTHSIHKDKNMNQIYSSYITNKIRLIWLLKGVTIIILYKVMTDHDYNKIRKLFPMIIKIADMIK